MGERYMMIMLSGRFKGEVDLRWHMVSISNTTHPNIPFWLWMEKIMLRRVDCQHCTNGWLFEARTGARTKFGRYNAMFRSLVTLARARNSWLNPAPLNPRASASGGCLGGAPSLRQHSKEWTPRRWR